MIINVCRPGRMETLTDQPYRVRWCFACRKRGMFRYIVKREAYPSPYEPVPSIICGNCGATDGDCFPGTSRGWVWDG